MHTHTLITHTHTHTNTNTHTLITHTLSLSLSLEGLVTCLSIARRARNLSTPQTDIDGALVGGASLVADKFGKIINFSQ